MPSLVDGNYRLLGAIQGSQPDRWYRQCIDANEPRRANGSYALSCDCSAWINNVSGNRMCKHTEQTAQLLDGTSLSHARAITDLPLTIRTVQAMQPLLQGIHGAWSVTECQASIGNRAYRWSLLEVALPGAAEAAPIIASAFVASALPHRPTLQDISAATAAWAGWAVAAEVARQAGWTTVGAPPNHHYRTPKRRGGRGQTAGNPASIGVYDLLDIGNRPDLGDGLTPHDRAEHCLRMFLGPRYEELQRQGFLDVSSRQYPGRVYRLRLDPRREVDRRLRVFEGGNNGQAATYRHDFCIVRPDRMVPAQDAFLTIFLGLLSDEQHVLRVVSRYNIFDPYSDNVEREVVPAIWTPRPTTT